MSAYLPKIVSWQLQVSYIKIKLFLFLSPEFAPGIEYDKIPGEALELDVWFKDAKHTSI